MMEWLGTRDGALLVWGLVSRALGAVFAIALTAHAYQARALYGSRGLLPLSDVLARHRRDFGALAFWYYPSLYWLSAADWTLPAVPLVGAAAAACAVVGGPWAPACLVAAWAAALSVDSTGTMFPWDSLLLETGFLATLLPATTLATWPLRAASLSAKSLPAPIVSFAFRWLLFRVLVGFGKLKFTGSAWRDRLYIKGFLIQQPIVTPAGLLAFHALPDAAWVALLAGMFVVELIAPFGLFFTGWPRVAAGASIAGLMAGIQLTGNFGYFNVLTAALCIPAAAHADALTFTRADLVPEAEAGGIALSPHAAATALLLGFVLPASVLSIAGSSWVSMGIWHWSGPHRAPRSWAAAPLLALARAHRFLSQFRLVASYGVFPPQSSPSARWAVAYEGSADGRAWRRYELHYYVSSPRAPPRFVAPWHPRLDHSIFYEYLGLSGTLFGHLSHNNPYAFPSSASTFVRLALRLLEGGASAASVAPFFRENPFPDPAAPPRYVRTLLCHYLPVPAAHTAATGEYWQERVMGLHLPPMSLASLAAQARLPPLPGDAPERAPPVTAGRSPLDASWPLNDASPAPEEWFAECVEWRRRAGVASAGVTPAEEAEAWAFVADLRAAAADAAVDAVDAAAAASATGANAGATSRRWPRSPSRSAVGVTAARGAGSAATTPPAGAAPPPVPLPHLRQSSAANVASQFVRLPLDGAAVRAGAAAVRGTPIDAPLPAAAADAVLVWSALPGAVARVRATRTLAQIARIRRTLARMAAPLLRAAGRVFHRPAPTSSELAAELLRAGTGGGGGGGGGDYADVREMVEPIAAYVDSTARHGLPPAGPDGLPVFGFAGNDDAPRTLYCGRPCGAMRGPQRWLMHAHCVMLVGGRASYRRVMTGLTGAPEVGPTPPRLAGAGRDALGRLPLPDVWTALTDGGRVHPAAMATEAGTFLLLATTFDATVTLAAVHHRAAAQSRPVRDRGEPPSSIVPAAVYLLPRVLAHHGLRAAHAPYAAPEAAAAAASNGDPTDVACGGAVAHPRVPLWSLAAGEATWDFGGTASAAS